MADGLAELTFERREGADAARAAACGRSVLARSRCRLPLRVIRPFYLDDSGVAYAVLVSPCGGLVGGDRMEVAVTLGPGASVCLSTQGATRVYRSTEGTGVDQTIRFDLAEGALLEYLPEQTIPFAGSEFRQQITVRLAAGATACLTDLLAPGRLARGEAFGFRRYRSSLRIEAGGRLLLLERVDLRGEAAGGGRGAGRPGSDPVPAGSPAGVAPEAGSSAGGAPGAGSPAGAPGSGNPAGSAPDPGGAARAAAAAAGLLGPGRLDGHLYSASLVLARGGPLPAGLADALHDRLAGRPGVSAGASAPEPGLVTARLLAAAHAPLAAALHDAWTFARGRLFGLPPLDLRKC